MQGHDKLWLKVAARRTDLLHEAPLLVVRQVTDSCVVLRAVLRASDRIRRRLAIADREREDPRNQSPMAVVGCRHPLFLFATFGKLPLDPARREVWQRAVAPEPQEGLGAALIMAVAAFRLPRVGQEVTDNLREGGLALPHLLRKEFPFPNL